MQCGPASWFDPYLAWWAWFGLQRTLQRILRFIRVEVSSRTPESGTEGLYHFPSGLGRKRVSMQGRSQPGPTEMSASSHWVLWSIVLPKLAYLAVTLHCLLGASPMDKSKITQITFWIEMNPVWTLLSAGVKRNGSSAMSRLTNTTLFWSSNPNNYSTHLTNVWYCCGAEIFGIKASFGILWTEMPVSGLHERVHIIASIVPSPIHSPVWS